MSANNYTLFKTELGTCALVWQDDKISGFQLPYGSEKLLLANIKRRYQATEAKPTAWVNAIIKRVQKHLAGTPQDFSDLPFLQQSKAPFHTRVYKQLAKIPSGKVLTYGELAKKSGSPKAARAVGAAMAANQIPLLLPCHRVMSNNDLRGFSAPGGLKTKQRLLEIEKAKL